MTPFTQVGNDIFNNPNGQIEDAIDGFYQIVNNWQVAAGLCGKFSSLAFHFPLLNELTNLTCPFSHFTQVQFSQLPFSILPASVLQSKCRPLLEPSWIQCEP